MDALSYLDRYAAQQFAAQLKKPYVTILFGARQTGKSTLIQQVCPKPKLLLDFSRALDRARYGADTDRFIQECQALADRAHPPTIVVDEAQMCPDVFNAVQFLYDHDKTAYRFILCGSSARKLRRRGANLLPGRSFYHRLHPLILEEMGTGQDSHSPLPRPGWYRIPIAKRFPPSELLDHLAFGHLPGIVTAEVEDRAELLRSYAAIYLEEEVRREAAVVNLAAFARFLKLAAWESGQILNCTALSQKIGLTCKTVQNYYSILEDMYVGFRVPAFSGSPRQGLLSTPRFYFFDLGVRHAAAGLPISHDMVLGNPGPLLEQWVGIELHKRLGYLNEGTLTYYRTKHGVEIDFIWEYRGSRLLFEVKWTDSPALHDARHLIRFAQEHPKPSSHGYIICRCPRPMQLDKHITALPWWML